MAQIGLHIVESDYTTPVVVCWMGGVAWEDRRARGTSQPTVSIQVACALAALSDITAQSKGLLVGPGHKRA